MTYMATQKKTRIPTLGVMKFTLSLLIMIITLSARCPGVANF